MRLLLFFILFFSGTAFVTAQSYYVKLVNNRQNSYRKFYPNNYYFVRLFDDQVLNLPENSINKYDSVFGIKLKLRYYENDTFYFTQNISIPFKSIFYIQNASPNIKILSGTLALNLICIGLFNYYTQRSYVDIRPLLWGNIFWGIPAAVQTIILTIPNETIYLKEWEVEEYSFKEARSKNITPKNIFEKKILKH